MFNHKRPNWFIHGSGIIGMGDDSSVSIIKKKEDIVDIDEVEPVVFTKAEGDVVFEDEVEDKGEDKGEDNVNLNEPIKLITKADFKKVYKIFTAEIRINYEKIGKDMELMDDDYQRNFINSINKKIGTIDNYSFTELSIVPIFKRVKKLLNDYTKKFKIINPLLYINNFDDKSLTKTQIDNYNINMSFALFYFANLFSVMPYNTLKIDFIFDNYDLFYPTLNIDKYIKDKEEKEKIITSLSRFIFFFISYIIIPNYENAFKQYDDSHNLIKSLQVINFDEDNSLLESNFKSDEATAFLQHKICNIISGVILNVNIKKVVEAYMIKASNPSLITIKFIEELITNSILSYQFDIYSSQPKFFSNFPGLDTLGNLQNLYALLPPKQIIILDDEKEDAKKPKKKVKSKTQKVESEAYKKLQEELLPLEQEQSKIEAQEKEIEKELKLAKSKADKAKYTKQKEIKRKELLALQQQKEAIEEKLKQERVTLEEERKIKEAELRKGIEVEKGPVEKPLTEIRFEFLKDKLQTYNLTMTDYRITEFVENSITNNKSDEIFEISVNDKIKDMEAHRNKKITDLSADNVYTSNFLKGKYKFEGNILEKYQSFGLEVVFTNALNHGAIFEKDKGKDKYQPLNMINFIDNTFKITKDNVKDQKGIAMGNVYDIESENYYFECKYYEGKLFNDIKINVNKYYGSQYYKPEFTPPFTKTSNKSTPTSIKLLYYQSGNFIEYPTSDPKDKKLFFIIMCKKDAIGNLGLYIVDGFNTDVLNAVRKADKKTNTFTIPPNAMKEIFIRNIMGIGLKNLRRNCK